MLGVGTIGVTGLNTSFKTNAPYLQKLVTLYNAYKADKLSKSQYDYQRRKVISAFEQRIGPFTKALSRKKSQRQILRISRSKGKTPTANITKQIRRMNKMATYAKVGGGLLTAASLGLACQEIGNTDSSLQKNHILVESFGGGAGA